MRPDVPKITLLGGYWRSATGYVYAHEPFFPSFLENYPSKGPSLLNDKVMRIGGVIT